MSGAFLITKAASRFWDGEIILIDRSHPLVNGVRVHGFACILRHELADPDGVRMHCCLGACRACVETAIWSSLAARPSVAVIPAPHADCNGVRVTVVLPRGAPMTRYKGPLPPPTHLINEYP